MDRPPPEIGLGPAGGRPRSELLKANKTGPNVANPVTDGKSGRPFVDFLAWSACTLVADQLVGRSQEDLSTISANGGTK
jgi:hypothetical protein